MSENTTYVKIYQRLLQEFLPEVLKIKDQSADHQGHQEAGLARETHFQILMVSSKFNDQNMITRHRAVNQVLKDLLKTSVHALSLTLWTPQEYQKNEKINVE